MTPAMPVKPLKTPAPPIVTADGYEMAVGDTVYRVHTRCCVKNLPTIEAVKVIQLDLSSSRKVRLRNRSGVESEWTSNEPLFKKHCDSLPKELLYATRRAAIKVAREAAAKVVAELQRKIAEERRALDTNLANNRRDVVRAVSAHRAYKLRVSKIGK